ncbi:predicted protein [Arabidopsis lyrata subsp. lyrata]|uniref:Predicted protein n=1 Tax=Arabidopsis lyrata subsp. lyrata TaxID=81972 RepID=D7M9W1_ARALL|nr:predicted protein [Arabidopsis lyrata subsp. lyrata]
MRSLTRNQKQGDQKPLPPRATPPREFTWKISCLDRPSTNPHRSHLLELIFLKRNTRDRSAVITGDRSKPSLIGNINRKTIQATGFRFHLVTWIKVLDSICAILKMIGILH